MNLQPKIYADTASDVIADGPEVAPPGTVYVVSICADYTATATFWRRRSEAEAALWREVVEHIERDSDDWTDDLAEAVTKVCEMIHDIHGLSLAFVRLPHAEV